MGDMIGKTQMDSVKLGWVGEARGMRRKGRGRHASIPPQTWLRAVEDVYI